MSECITSTEDDIEKRTYLSCSVGGIQLHCLLEHGCSCLWLIQSQMSQAGAQVSLDTGRVSFQCIPGAPHRFHMRSDQMALGSLRSYVLGVGASSPTGCPTYIIHNSFCLPKHVYVYFCMVLQQCCNPEAYACTYTL